MNNAEQNLTAGDVINVEKMLAKMASDKVDTDDRIKMLVSELMTANVSMGAIALSLVEHAALVIAFGSATTAETREEAVKTATGAFDSMVYEMARPELEKMVDIAIERTSAAKREAQEGQAPQDQEQVQA